MANKNKDHEYLVYQRNKYHNIPLWVIMNTLTFGQISKMFEFLPQNMQGTICQDFGNVKKNEMIKYLKVLTLYRNVCAHNERLFSYHTYIDIPDTLLHKKLGISKNGSKYIYGKNDLFSVVITFRYLLPKTDFLLFKKQLLHIFDRYEKQNSNLKLNDLFEYMGDIGAVITDLPGYDRQGQIGRKVVLNIGLNAVNEQHIFCSSSFFHDLKELDAQTFQIVKGILPGLKFVEKIQRMDADAEGYLFLKTAAGNMFQIQCGYVQIGFYGGEAVHAFH